MWGGDWTRKKLAILEGYLDAYTTALRNKPFELWYIDAFAGSGRVELPDEDRVDIRSIASGSAERAVKVDNRPFDRLVFVERDSDRCAELEELRAAHRHRYIRIENSDANEYLCSLDGDWRGRRGMLFLDPFATQVNWSTLQKVASYQALDTWILFPISSISRILPNSRIPDEIAPQWAARLTSVFGDESWRNLYRPRRQKLLFDPDAQEREPGLAGILEIYKSRLTELFGDRFLPESRPLKNSRNSTLFEFLFCAGHPAGATVAKKIAKHMVLKKL